MDAPADSEWRGYSTAERDRRWAAVRENAADTGLDCIFVPLGNGHTAGNKIPAQSGLRLASEV